MSEFERGASLAYIKDIDHRIASQVTLETTFYNTDTLINFAGIEAEQREVDSTAYETLLKLGRHFVPLDSEGNVSSETAQYHAYIIAMNLALTTLDALCERLDIDIEMFRKAWQINGYVMVLDLNADTLKSLTPAEQYEAIAAGIAASGHATLDAVGPAYDELIDAMTYINQSTVAHTGILRGSFGYILDGGLRTLNRIMIERDARSITASVDFDSELECLTECMDGKIDRSSTKPVIDHASIANEIDTHAFYAEDSAVEYLGKLVESQLAKDERNVEILNALALVTYQNDYENFSLDEEGEAFFIGATLGLNTVEAIAAEASINVIAFLKTWRGHHIHRKLRDMRDVPVERVEIIDIHVAKVLSESARFVKYDELLMKLSDALDYEEEAAIAFRSGFHYMMSTGNDAIRNCSAAEISRQVKRETADIDEEIKRLMG